MKKYFYQTLIFLILSSVSFQVQADGLIGGYLDFTHKGGSTYTIKATLFIDKGAYPNSPSFLYINNFITVGIFSKGASIPADVRIQDVRLDYVSAQDNFPYENQECVTSISLSTTKIIFSKEITLNKALYNNSGGYIISYRDGSRNITNNTLPTGIIINLEFPNLNVQDNNSPVFKLDKGVVACKNNPFSIDLGATDADGNTLTYALVNPYAGSAGVTRPSDKQYPPPFARSVSTSFLVPWAAGFSNTSPLTGSVSLNPTTGVLTGTATAVGKYVLTVECREFRGTTLIGLNRLDFEIFVENCTSPKPKIFLSGENPGIHINSIVICDGSYRILETPNNVAFTYQWQKNGVNVAGANKYQLKVLYVEQGDYTVIVTRTGTCAGTETSLKTELRPQAGENIRLTAVETSFCDGGSTVLTLSQNSTGAAVNNFRREWYKDGVVDNSIFGTSNIVNKSGRYKVVLIQFLDPKCIYADSVDIKVIPIPKAEVTNTSNKTSVCQGENITLTALQETGNLYQWVKDGVNIPPPTGNATSLSVTQTGTYRLDVLDATGTCSNSSSPTISLQVNPYPTVTFNPVAPLCSSKSDKIDLRNLVQPNYVSPLGVFTGAGLKNAYEFDPTASGYGSFIIKYTYTTPEGCGKSASQTIIIDQTPNIKLGNDITIFKGESVKIKSVGSTGNQYAYEWTPVMGLDAPNVAQPLASPDVTTEYTVKVSSILSKCFATDKIVITVRSILNIPNAFTPNNDNLNDTWAIMDNNRESNDYPDIEVKIYNRWGGEIFSSIGSRAYQTQPFDGIKNGERLPAGTYFYVIKPSRDVQSLTGYVTIVR